MCVDSQALVVIVYVCLIFNNFSNFQGSALIIYSAVLRKSMNETVFKDKMKTQIVI